MNFTTRRPRKFRSQLIASALAAVLAVTGLTVAPAEPALASGFGEVKTTDYGSAPVSGGAYCWRGYAFKVAETTTVTHLIGGGTIALSGTNVFKGAIYSASGGTGSTPGTPSAVLREVTFPGSTFNQVVSLSSELTLNANTWYFLIQGRVIGSVLHHYVSTFDRDGLVNGNDRITDWLPPASAGGDAYYFNCGGEPSANLNLTPTLTSQKPALGFRYLSDVSPTSVSTNPDAQSQDDGVALSVGLTSTGGGTASLWVEHSRSSDFTSADSKAVTVRSAIPSGATVPILENPTVTTSGSNFIFTYSTGVSITLAQNTTYYWRARGTNDFGAISGDTWAMSLGPTANHPSRIWVNIAEGTTAPPIPPAVVPAPTLSNLVLTPSDGQVSVNFSISGVADNFEYSLDGGETYIVRSPSSNSLPWIIATTDGTAPLVNGTEYNLSIRGRNIDNVSTALTASVVPGVPLAPVISSVTSGVESLSVDFSIPTPPSPVTSLEYSLDDGSTWALADSTSNPLVLSDAVVASGNTYQIRLRATNEFGLGLVSNPAVSGTPLGVPLITLSYASTTSHPHPSVSPTLDKGGSSGSASYSLLAYNASDAALGCQVNSSTGVVTAATAGKCRVQVSVAAAGNFAQGVTQAFVEFSKSTSRVALATAANALTIHAVDGATRPASFTIDPDDANNLSVELKIGETLAIPYTSPNAAAIFGFTSNDRCTAVRNPANAAQAMFAQTASGSDAVGVYYLRANQLGSCAQGDQSAGFAISLDARAYEEAGLSQRVFVNVVAGDQRPIAVSGASSAVAGQTIVLSATGGSSTGARSYSVTAGDCTIETVEFSLFGQAYPSLNTARLTSAGADSCQVAVTQAGDDRFEPVTSAPFTVTFGKQGQSLRFTSTVPAQPAAGSTYLPVAVATSGLAPSYSVSGMCSIAGGTNVVTFSGAGPCTISASQAGDDAFNAATTISQLIQVGQRNQTISIPQFADRSFASPPFRIAATSTESNLTVALTSADTSVCQVDSLGTVTITAVGTCTINADQAGLAGTFAAAPRVVRSFEVRPARPAAPSISAVSSTTGSLVATVLPSAMTGGSAITHYEMQVFGTGANAGVLVASNSQCAAVAPGSLQTCTVSGLATGVSYSVKVRAVNIVGPSPLSTAWSPATTLFNPLAARNFTARANSPLTVTWQAPDSVGGETFVRYDLYLKLSSASDFPATPTHSENCSGSAVACDGSHTFTGLTAGAGYDILIFVVTVEQALADSFYTNLISFTAPVTADSVENLTVVQNGGDLVISWEYPQNDGGSEVINYLVLIDGEPVAGCDPVSIRLCIVDMAGVQSFNVTVIPVTAVGEGLSALQTYQVPRAGSSAAVYTGPIVSSVSNRSPLAGERVILLGQRLGLVTAATVGGKSVTLSAVAGGGLAFIFPDGLPAGTVNLVLRSSAGQLTVQGLFTVRGSLEGIAGPGRNLGVGQEPVTPMVWLREYQPGKFKVYAFDVVGAGKLQVKVDGKEVAWLNATSISDDRLRQAGSGEPYFVRTVQADSEGQISIVVNGIALSFAGP